MLQRRSHMPFDVPPFPSFSFHAFFSLRNKQRKDLKGIVNHCVIVLQFPLDGFLRRNLFFQSKFIIFTRMCQYEDDVRDEMREGECIFAMKFSKYIYIIFLH